MAETTPLRNTLSRRYSTTRPLGFRGGSIGPGGNMQPPTAGQVAGVNPPAPKAEEKAPISQFSAAVPRPAGVGPAGAVAAGVGGQLAAGAAKEGIKRGISAISGLMTSPISGFSAPAADGSQFYASDTMQQSFPLGEQNMSRAPGSFDLGLEYGSTPGTVPDWVGVGTQPFDPTIGFEEGATSLMGDGFTAGAVEYSAPTAVDAASSIYDSGMASFDPTIGFEEGATSLMGDAGDAAGGGVPFLGAGIRAAQGDWGGAGMSAAGTAIGNAILPGVGGPIGGFIGGALSSACFITEAVMSAGGQDGGPELNILRGFRDQVMMSTPIGQSMVQQYEAIAPLVVEAVTQRPDALEIFQSIKAQFIDPAVAAVQAGDNTQALMIYAKMIAFVTPFAIEAQVGPGGEPAERPMPGQEGMDQMGSMAAMLEHSPEMATSATGGAPEGGMMMQNDQLPGGPGQTTSPPPMIGGGNMQNGAMAPMAGTFARRRY